jgi:hypothetical protein
MPQAPRAKMAMAGQSLLSLVILGLEMARGVKALA